MNGELKKKYDRALIMLPNQKLPILVHIRKHFLSIQGYKHIYLDSLNKLCSSGALEQIRNNIPYKETELSAILGADILPSIYVQNLVLDPNLNVGVGKSVFGSFGFGKFLTAQRHQSMYSGHNLAISCKQKNFQISLERLISNHFEVDETQSHEKYLTLGQLNAEQEFLKNIQIRGNTYYTSPILNPLIPAKSLAEYMIPFRTANAHHKRLVKRLKLLAPKLRNFYHG